ncbi:MAG: SDR family NAD(P)-dependent oxidoreductase, partial [Caulobacterales bacterium]
MDLGLKGKKVILGGATRGISKAAANLLAAEGCDLAVFSRNGDALEELQAQLAVHGGKVFSQEFFLDDRDEYRALLTGFADKLGGCDIFIHSIS